MMKDEQRICAWRKCSSIIPSAKKKTAKYCCDDHYYEAKKERSSKSYHTNTAVAKEIKRNEKILENFYLLVELNKDFDFHDLNKKKFNWGVSQGETVGPDNLIGNIIGRFAYNLNKLTKNVVLWNLKDVR